MRYRVHFEPVEAENPHHVEEVLGIIYDAREEEVTIRKIVPIDKDGFPINLEKQTINKQVK